jgi:CubicO group peptidase (beta-lactamase class C family)
MELPESDPNRDLVVGSDRRPRWNEPDHRRRGFHDLHLIAKYAESFRAARVMRLERRMDLRIAEREDVRRLTTLPWFSAMVVLRGSHILYERYAADFGPDRPHTIMSISKTVMNLIVGRLVEQGAIDTGKRVADYLPWIGPGYAGATVQQVLDMDVANDYSEDYSDPLSSCFLHEAANGWRLPEAGKSAGTMRSFIAGIGFAAGQSDTRNRSGKAMYRSANTDVLAFIAEAVTGRPMRAFLADIADAAGIEGCLHMSCDRDGFPIVDGGISMTARDLARYGSIFVRHGRGIDGGEIGSAGFIERTLASGVPMTAPRSWLRYSNMTNTEGRWLGHGGYGGQYMLADLTSGVVGIFFSVLENRDAYDADYYVPIIRMLEDIARRAE